MTPDVRRYSWNPFFQPLPPKFQLNTFIPENVSRLQDGLKLSLLVPYIQTFKIRQERLNRPWQPLCRGDPGSLFLSPEGQLLPAGLKLTINNLTTSRIGLRP